MTATNMNHANGGASEGSGANQSQESFGESKGQFKSAVNFTNDKFGQFTETINKMAGGQGRVELRFRDFFVEVPKKHTAEERDRIFTCGTATTTPSPEQISTDWPKPWLYSRVLLVLMITYVIMYQATIMGGKALPAAIFIGALASPLSILIFLFEINAPRNINIMEVLLYFMLGGGASILFTMVLYNFISLDESLNLMDAAKISLVEEIGKMLAVCAIMMLSKKIKYILNGMLIGGAVGSGFAAMESAGYGLESAIERGDIQEITLVRGIVAPGGHVVWAAITGAAIMIALNHNAFTFKALTEKKFLTLFAIPLVLHAVWDWSAADVLGDFKYVILIVIPWIVLAVLMKNGLDEINNLSIAPGGQ